MNSRIHLTHWHREGTELYRADLPNCSARVMWKAGQRWNNAERGFVWTLTWPDGREQNAPHTEEEPEVAMFQAEEAAKKS